MRPTWAEIDLRSIKSNLETVRSLTGDGVSIMAVVKADAYGHGAVKVSRALTEHGADSLAVATLEEGLQLRGSGIKCPVMIIGSIQKSEIPEIIKNELTPAVYDVETLRSLSGEIQKSGRVLDFHLRIDTGMNRLGIHGGEVRGFINEHRAHTHLNLQGVFTHLASADDPKSNFTDRQISEFYGSLELIRSLNVEPRYFHLANSAAIQNYPGSHGNLVRPGIMLYGAGEQDRTSLRSAMKLKSRIIQLKNLEKGTPVSYGGTHVTEKRSVIATAPIGYADGYFRKLSNRAYVSIRGKKAKVVGRVCMDFIMIDVTSLSREVRVGDEITLFGDELVTINDISSWAETTPYEVLTLVGKRVPRTFV